MILQILLMTYALTPGNLEVLAGELSGLHIDLLFAAAGMAVILWINRENNLRKNKWLKLLCAFFAFTTVLGESYYVLDNWNYLFGSVSQFLIALLVMAGYFFLYLNLISVGGYAIKHFGEIRRTEPRGKLENVLFEEHPFCAVFLFAMLFSIPYMISFYPGTIQSDAFEQLYNYMGIIEFSNHHPVVSTKIMGKCIAIGREVFGSDNIGLFIYTLSQSVLQWTGIAYLFCVLKKMDTPIWIRWFGLLFLTVFPLYPMWGYTLVKDTQYYISLLFFAVSFTDILLDGAEKRKHWKKIVFYCAAYSMILCRKDGRYVVALALIGYVFFYRKQWKMYLFTGISGFLILFAVEQIYMPAHGITEGRIAEALSIPIQQTARYARDHGDEITAEENQVMSELFDDYSELGLTYTPEISDASKRRMIDNPTKEQLKDYVKVWFAQFCKHPDTYFQAFFNQTYGYFYADRKDSHETPVVAQLLGREELLPEEFHIGVSFIPQLKGARTFLNGITNLTTKLPVIALLYSAGFHGYLLIGCVIYLCAGKRKKDILYMAPSLLTFLVCILSPVNGGLRYMLPVMILLPLNISWCAYCEKTGEKTDK